MILVSTCKIKYLNYITKTFNENSWFCSIVLPPFFVDKKTFIILGIIFIVAKSMQRKNIDGNKIRILVIIFKVLNKKYNSRALLCELCMTM